MAAPTNAAKREKSSCQPGAVHTWHLADMSGRADDVRFAVVKRKSDFMAVMSPFDPLTDLGDLYFTQAMPRRRPRLTSLESLRDHGQAKNDDGR
jgi:hypothetical protein